MTLQLNFINKIKDNKMTITKNRYSGAITVSDIINNQLVEKTFYYYTIAECKKIFKRECK